MSMGEELALDLAYEGRVAPATPQAARLLALAERINALPDPEIDETFAAELEARLLADVAEAPARHLHSVPARAARPAPVAPVRPAAVIPLPRRRWVVRKHLVAAVAAAMLIAFPIAAGASALPGTPFHSFKVNVIERIELMFSGSDIAKGFKHLDLADRRIGEISQLLALGAEAPVSGTLRLTQGEQSAGVEILLGATTDQATLQRAADILDRQAGRLSSLAPGFSTDLRQVALQAAAFAKSLVARLTGPSGAVEGTSELAGTATVPPASSAVAVVTSGNPHQVADNVARAVPNQPGTPTGANEPNQNNTEKACPVDVINPDAVPQAVSDASAGSPLGQFC